MVISRGEIAARTCWEALLLHHTINKTSLTTSLHFSHIHYHLSLQIHDIQGSLSPLCGPNFTTTVLNMDIDPSFVLCVYRYLPVNQHIKYTTLYPIIIQQCSCYKAERLFYAGTLAIPGALLIIRRATNDSDCKQKG